MARVDVAFGAEVDGAGAPLELTLEQSLKLVEEQNPQLAAARAAVQATDGSLTEARSGLYPHVQASAGAFRLESPPMLMLGPVTSQLGRENMGFINFGVTQTLYAGGRISGGIEAAEFSRALAEARERATRDEVRLQVKNAFYGVVFARELVKLREESLNALREHLTTTQQRYRRGTAAEFDTLRAEVEATNAQPPLIEAKNQLSQMETNLKRAVGLDQQTRLSLIGDLTERPVALMEREAQVRALDCRAEGAAAHTLVRIAQTQQQIARAGDKPTVSLFANYFGTAPEYFVASSAEMRWNKIAGITFSLPLFAGFETRGRLGRTGAESAEAQARERDVREQIRLEVHHASLRLAEAESLLAAQGQNVQQAERAARIAQLRYEQGVGTQLDVLDSQVALTQARVNRLSALYRHELAVAELRRAVGCSLEPAAPGEQPTKRGSP